MCVFMASEPTMRPEESHPETVQPRRLWFGLSAAFFCWFLVGIAEMFITWRACLRREQMGNAFSDPSATAASFVVTFFLIGVVAAAGYLSYSSWRRLSSQPKFLEAEGRGRREFMALVGVIASLTLGVGMVWMSLPLFILRLCARMR